MSNTELIKNLENLKNDIYNYAEYLKDYTYHPYSKVLNFANELDLIINNFKQ